MGMRRDSVLSRRGLIVFSVTAAGGALVAACGQAPVAASTASTASVAATTAAVAAPASTASTAATVASTSAATTASAPATTATSSAVAAASTTAASTSAAATTSAASTSVSAAAASSAAPLAAGQNAMTWSCYSLGEPAQTYWNDTFKAAQQATGVTVNASWESGTNYWDKRQAEVAANSPNVDIMVNQLNWIVPGGLNGMFVDHTTYMQRDKVDPAEYYAARPRLLGLEGQAMGDAHAERRQRPLLQ